MLYPIIVTAVEAMELKKFKVSFREIMASGPLNERFNVLDMFSSVVENPTKGEFVHVSGYVHILKEGNANLISVDIQLYPIASTVVLTNRLQMGDYVSGIATFDYEKKRYIMKDISEKHQGRRFEHQIGVMPHNEIQLFDSPVKLGSRVVIETGKTYDRMNHSIKLIEDMKKQDVVPVVLVIEESGCCVPFLASHGIEHVFTTEINYNPLKQVLVTLLAIFRAKSLAEEGKNVIFVINNLSKLFKVYNKSMGIKAGEETTSLLEIQDKINVAALSDLKSIVMTAKQLEQSGSVTVLGYISKAQTRHEEYVNSGVCDLANVLAVV